MTDLESLRATSDAAEHKFIEAVNAYRRAQQFTQVIFDAQDAAWSEFSAARLAYLAAAHTRQV